MLLSVGDERPPFPPSAAINRPALGDSTRYSRPGAAPAMPHASDFDPLRNPLPGPGGITFALEKGRRVHASGAAFRLRLVHEEGRAMSLVRDALADAAERAEAVDAARPDDDQVDGAGAVDEGRDRVRRIPRVHPLAPGGVTLNR